MNQEEYISIAEFAMRAGISKQAVYQRLNKSLKNYVKVEQGKKYININALEDLYGKEYSSNCSSVEQDNSTLKQDHIFNKLIDTLQEELKKKDEQLTEKDLQIRELHNLLDQQQKLAALDRQKIAELEQKIENDSEEAKEPEIEKKWWQFWK